MPNVKVTPAFCFPQPLIIVANKCDVKKISELSEEDQVTHHHSRMYPGETRERFSHPDSMLCRLRPTEDLCAAVGRGDQRD